MLGSTGDADAEVKKLMGESAQLSSSQQEAEAHLQHSKEAIQELQAALRNAQVRIAVEMRCCIESLDYNCKHLMTDRMW